MSIEVWGLMPKSQIDNETIEEAIERLIAEHEHDPTSHLGENESIEAHRKSEVIDHLALSIVPDKFSNAETFVNIGTYPVETGETENATISGGNMWLSVMQSSPTSGAGTALFTTINPYDLNYNDGDIIFDFMLYAYGYAGTWQTSFDFTWGTVQLKYGYYRVGYYDGSWHYTDWIAHSVFNPLRFRFFYKQVDGKLYIYLRNELVATFTFTPYFIDDETMLMQFLINRGTATSATLVFGSCKIWMDGF